MASCPAEDQILEAVEEQPKHPQIALDKAPGTASQVESRQKEPSELEVAVH